MPIEQSYTPDIIGLIDGNEQSSDVERAAYREAASKHLRVLTTVMAYLLDAKNPKLAIAIACSALGLSLNQGKSGEQIAQEHGVTRAEISKYQLRLQRALGLPPALGQKSQESRQRYSETRKGQLV